MEQSSIDALRDDINELKIRWEDELEKREKRAQAKRIENIHVLVALGIFGAFTSGVSEQYIGQALEPAFRNIGWIAVLYLLLKLTTLSMRPILPSDDDSYMKFGIKTIDDTILQILFVVLLYSGFSIVILDQLPDFQNLLTGILPIEILFWLQIVVLIKLGYIYSKKYKTTMSLKSSSTDSVLVFPSNTSGSDLSFKITNPTDSPIQSGDLEFVVNAPDGVSIKNFHSAVSTNGKWENAYSIPAGANMRFVISISTDSSTIDKGEHNISIKILHDGEEISEEDLYFEI